MEPAGTGSNSFKTHRFNMEVLSWVDQNQTEKARRDIFIQEFWSSSSPTKTKDVDPISHIAVSDLLLRSDPSRTSERCQVQVCSQSPQSELNMEKQRSVLWSSRNLQVCSTLSSLTPGWRSFCSHTLLWNLPWLKLRRDEVVDSEHVTQLFSCSYE